MLHITTPAVDLWDEEKQEFDIVKEHTLCLEHSLVSLSKWESKWHKPFLTKDTKTHDETVDYIRCMTITQNVDPNVYKYIPDDIIQQVYSYIDDPMTATWFSDQKKKTTNRINNEQVTSELVYYWMTKLNIPFECQKWHLNRLLTLIQVCNVKENQPNQKMGQREILRNQAALNAARKKKLNTKG